MKIYKAQTENYNYKPTGLNFKRVKQAIRSFQKYTYKIERFLDIGCGDGDITIRIQEEIHAQKVYGLELDKVACKNAEKQGIFCTQMDLDKNVFPFADDYFDAIYCGEIIEHVFDPDHLLDEIYRTLKPNGVCVLDTPNLASSVNRIALLFGLQPYMTSVSERYYFVGRIGHKGGSYHQHIRLFTYRALKELLKLHDFSVLETRGFTWSDNSANPFPKLIRMLERIIFCTPSLAYNIEITLRKKKINKK